MMVFWQERLAFLATPKTASTAIESALGGLASLVIPRPDRLKHTNAQAFVSHIAPWLEAGGAPFEMAALMREPRAWLGSWFRDRQREETPADLSTRGVSFDDFVRAACAPGPRPAFADVGSQAGFLTTGGGRAVDHLFRYERLEDFMHFLEDRLQCEVILPRLKVSPQADLGLSAATEALLHDAMAADFALYDSIRRG